MNPKLIIGFVIGIFVLGGALVVVMASQSSASQHANDEDAPILGGTTAPEVTENDHFKGGEDAPVVLIEYGDFQCPTCQSFHPVVSQLHEEFGDNLKIVYRHFPLRGSHENADVAARASEAAALQGKFWEMHDMLFENQRRWASNRNAKDVFARYAEDIDLDRDQFLEDIESDKVKEKVQNDLDGGTASQVRGTPTFFLQGQNMTRLPQRYSEFRDYIQQELDKATAPTE